ncbi:uncharacterized protein LOC120340977 isoform X1 [Styela clava]
MARAVIDDYRTSLEDLTFNSKPHINALTMLAEEYLPHADVIVRLIEAKLNKAPSNGKLPLMYLMDSIVKNVKKNYVPLFAENLVKSFNTTFDTGDEKTKISLYKLRSTWDSYFPLKTLYKLDVAVNNIDSAWPVKPLPASLQEKPSTSIHVNPKFLKKVDAVPVTSVAVDTPAVHDSVDLKQDLINKQKQLLDLQQQKLLLELEQTKQQLAMREKRNQLAAKKQPEAVSKDPRLKQAATSVAPTGLRVTVVTNGQKPQVRGNTKDPRNQTAAKNTHPPSAETKKQPATLDPRAKNVAIKKSPANSPAEKPKIVKKSPNDTEKIKKKKVSPQTVKRLAKTSPKNFAKNEAKKTKLSKKKTEVKTVKNTQSEAVQQSKENIGQKGQTKHIDGEISKKRDRPGRRSPPRNQAPPAKLARRSTSIERRSPSSPIRRRLEHPKNASIQRSAAAREVEQIRRDSPMPSDGSISPRFSPEPDESPVKRNRNWRPPVKRIRHIQSPPESWQREEMPPRPSPPVRRRTSVDPNVRIPQELTLGHQAEILKQAEIQLQSGQLTHTQHQELLKQLHQLFELQRLRSLQHVAHHEMPLRTQPPIPLNHHRIHNEDYIQHDQANFSHDVMQRQDENRPPPFRPPPSPPRMEMEQRDRNDYSRPLHSQRLTPPPMPPTDPRMNHHPYRPSPQREDQHFVGQDVYIDHIEPPPRPAFLNERHEQMEIDNRRRGPGPGPIRRRHSGEWERPPQGRSVGGYGEDTGNVFVIESSSQSPVREEPFLPIDAPNNRGRHPRGFRQSRNLNSQRGKKVHSERVPLRAYAHPETESEPRRPVPLKRKDTRDRPRRSPPRKTQDRKLPRHSRKHSPVSERNKRIAKKKDEKKQEKSDGEEDIPRLEEPEDYIIANIPPEAEVYHKHSMSLKKTRTASDSAQQDLQKQSSSESLSDVKEEITEVVPKSDENAGNNSPMHLSSPDINKKIDEEVNRSPSLPLKKRKYLISSSSDLKDDAGTTTEPESDTADLQLKDAATVEIEKKDIQSPKHDGESEEKPEVDDDQPSEKPSDNLINQEQELDSKDKESDNLSKELASIDKEIAAEDKTDLEKIENAAQNDKKYTEKTPEKSPERDIKDNKHEGRLKRIQELAMKDGSKTPAQKKMMKDRIMEKGRDKSRNKDKGRKREVMDDENLTKSEKERMDVMMAEEEEMLRWEAELEKELEREEFARIQEMEAHGRGPMQNRGGGPMRRGWGRDRGGGRGFGRERRDGRRNWGGNEEFWEEEPPGRIPPLMPMDKDRPPFPDRRRPERMRPHPDRMPPHPRDREWFGPHDRNRRGPPPPEFDGPWVDDEPRGPPMRGGRFEPRGRFRPGHGPPDDRMLPPHHRDERMEMNDRRGPPIRDDMPGPHPMHEPRGPPSPPRDEMNQVNVNKLLSDLLNMGIIPGNKPKPVEVEKSSSSPPSRNASPLPINPTLANIVKPEKPASPDLDASAITSLAKSSVAIEQEATRVPTPVFEDLLTLDPDANLPEVTFNDVDKLKIRCDDLIKRLYTGIQCSACGMRFTACQTDMYAEHLDWHYRANRKDKDGVKETHRTLYPTAGEWIMYEEIVDPSQRAKNQVFDEEMEQGEETEAPAKPQNSEDLVVPVAQHPEQDKCNVCHEAFKTVYNDEEEEWQYVNCVAVDGKNFHPNCYADHNDQRDSDPLPTPIRVPLYNPMESSLKGIPGLDTLLTQDESKSEEEADEQKENADQPEEEIDAESGLAEKDQEEEFLKTTGHEETMEQPAFAGNDETEQADDVKSEINEENSKPELESETNVDNVASNDIVENMTMEPTTTSSDQEPTTEPSSEPTTSMVEDEMPSESSKETQPDETEQPDGTDQPFVILNPANDAGISSQNDENKPPDNIATEETTQVVAPFVVPTDESLVSAVNNESDMDATEIDLGKQLVEKSEVSDEPDSVQKNENFNSGSDSPIMDNTTQLSSPVRENTGSEESSDHESDNDSDDGGVTVTI